MRTGVGSRGSVRLPQTSGRGSGEASANSVCWGKEQREQLINVTVTKRHELCNRASTGTKMNGHLPDDGGGLPWLGMTGAGREQGRAGCLQSYKPLLWLGSFTLTQQAGRVMCWRGTEQPKNNLIGCRFLLRPNYVPSWLLISQLSTKKSIRTNTMYHV